MTQPGTAGTTGPQLAVHTETIKTLGRSRLVFFQEKKQQQPSTDVEQRHMFSVILFFGVFFFKSCAKTVFHYDGGETQAVSDWMKPSPSPLIPAFSCVCFVAINTSACSPQPLVLCHKAASRENVTNYFYGLVVGFFSTETRLTVTLIQLSKDSLHS